MRITIVKNGNVFNIRKESVFKSILGDSYTLFVVMTMIYFNNVVFPHSWIYDVIAGCLLVGFLWYVSSVKTEIKSEAQLITEFKSWAAERRVADMRKRGDK